MEIFFVFWDSVMASICFVLSTILKGIEAFFEALLDAIMDVLIVLLVCGGGALIIYLCVYSAKLLKSGEFFSAILDVVGVILILGLVIAIVGGLAAPILGIIGAIIGAILGAIYMVASFLYEAFEKGYLFFLKRITVRLNTGKQEIFENNDEE